MLRITTGWIIACVEALVLDRALYPLVNYAMYEDEESVNPNVAITPFGGAAEPWPAFVCSAHSHFVPKAAAQGAKRLTPHS